MSAIIRLASAFSECVLHCICAQATTAAAREQEARSIVTLFIDPGFKHNHRGFGQWGASFFASFAFAADVGTGAEHHILLLQPGNLRESQTCLHGDQQQSVIAPPYPDGFVHTGKHSFNLRASEVVHQSPGEPLIRDREHSLDYTRVLRGFQCGVMIKRSE
jgi:hypothetical protein